MAALGSVLARHSVLLHSYVSAHASAYRLMLQRIKWEEDTVKGKEDEDTENKCALIWEVNNFFAFFVTRHFSSFTLLPLFYVHNKRS